MFSGTAVSFNPHNYPVDEENWDPDKLHDSPCKAQSFESNPRTLLTHLPINQKNYKWTPRLLTHLLIGQVQVGPCYHATPSLVLTRRTRGLAAGKSCSSPLRTRHSGREISPSGIRTINGIITHKGKEK